jgi:VanZ family protein
MALIFLVSSIPGVRAPGVSDKTAHALAYGGLALLILRALVAGDWRGVTAPAVLQAALAASAYGAVDEWHQSFVRDRAAEMADVWADATGAAIAAGAVWAWSIIRRLRRRSSGRDAVRTPDRRA